MQEDQNESDLEAMDESEVGGGVDGRFRFENVVKSMVARLELYNGLAPKQEYGRHLAHLNVKKKKDANKIQEDSEINNLNDQFYDLDDNFIDDGEIESDMQDEGYTELLNEESGIDKTSDTRNLVNYRMRDPVKIASRF